MQSSSAKNGVNAMGNETAQVVTLDGLVPERESIGRLLHLQPGRTAHGRWFERLDELLNETAPLVRGRGVFKISSVVSRSPQQIGVASGAVFDGHVVRHLRDVLHVATFIVTIGSALERLARRWLKAGRVMEGTIVDAIASETAEAAADRLQLHVQEWAHAHDLEITPRFSPGYCGLHVQQQIPLFDSLPARRINVRLKPSCLMLPMKSVSGLIGVGPTDRVSPIAYPCAMCNHPDCVQRRAPFDADRYGPPPTN